MFKKVRHTAFANLSTSSCYLSGSKYYQLRWFGHIRRMPQERLPKQTLCAKVNPKRPVSRTTTEKLIDYIEDLGWNRLGLRTGEMQSELLDRV